MVERIRCGGWLILLAVLYTGINALKPLQVDDAAYYYYAAHLAEHPLDPYGFEIYWYQWPHPANEVLAPPVLPYWWSLAIRLFGQHPVLWKWWLLPISLLFVVSLHAVFRRFARGLEMPLVWLTVLSPVFLPSLNLMLDVPALALALASLELFFRACDVADRTKSGSSSFIRHPSSFILSPSVLLAVLSGLVAGLAMQTKYTAFLAPAAMGLYAIVVGSMTPGLSWRARAAKTGLAFLAGGVAVGLFASWELWMAQLYGESHFLHHLHDNDRQLLAQLASFSLPLIVLVGGASPVLGLLGLTALGCRGRLIVAASLAVVGGYLLVGYCKAPLDQVLRPVIGHILDAWMVHDSLELAVFFVSGVCIWTTLTVAAWRVLRFGDGAGWRLRRGARQRTEWFLVLWLFLEVAGYFALTPFGAVRRIMGVVVVGTVLAGRLAALTCRPAARRCLIYYLAVGSCLLGLGFFEVDRREAAAEKRVVERALACVRERDPKASIWFTGHWGFQFSAEQAGMQAVIPDAEDQPLHQGDWLIVPDNHLEQQAIQIDPTWAEWVLTVEVEDRLPFRTVRCFYGTGTGVPLENHGGARIAVAVYRVAADHVPLTPPS